MIHFVDHMLGPVLIHFRVKNPYGIFKISVKIIHFLVTSSYTDYKTYRFSSQNL
jgi:hypothetical protein